MNVEVLHLLIPRFTMTPNAYVFIAVLRMLKLPFKIGPILLSQRALIRCYSVIVGIILFLARMLELKQNVVLTMTFRCIKFDRNFCSFLFLFAVCRY